MNKKNSLNLAFILIAVLLILPTSVYAREAEEAQMQNILQQLIVDVMEITLWPPYNNQPCLTLALSDLHNRLDEMAGIQAFWGEISGGAVDAINPPSSVREVLKELMKAAARDVYDRLAEEYDENDPVQIAEYKPGTVWNFLRGLVGDCDISLKVIWPERSNKFTVLFAGDCNCQDTDLDDFYIQFQGTLSENDNDENSPTHYDVVHLDDDFWNPDDEAQTKYFVNCCSRKDASHGVDIGEEVGQLPPKTIDRTLTVPQQFTTILGSGQTIGVKVNTEERGEQTFLVGLNRADEEKYTIALLTNTDAKPTMTVKTNEYVLWKLQNTDDKLGFAQEMLASGAIDVTATTQTLGYAYELGTVISKYNLIKKADMFDIKPGVKKDIDYNGVKAGLSLNVKNDRIVNTGNTNNLIVVNNVGRAEAYTTPRVQQIIASAPTRFSDSAGKYNIQLTNAKQNIAQQTRLPTINIQPSATQVLPVAQTPKQQAQQFVASRQPAFTIPRSGPAVISTPSQAVSAGAKYAYVASSYSSRPSYLIR